LEKQVADFITAEGLLKPDEEVLLAVSGGADSSALLNVTHSLFHARIHCAHINHQLRGVESGYDEDFVVEQCKKLNIPLTIRKIDVREYARTKKLSIETAARNLRMDCLLEIAKKQNCACIATAHHKNDNAETILQRMSRGTGLRGLCGIWPVKQFPAGARFIRPLLCVSRNQIIQYLTSRNLEWCEDRTNKDFAYRRNFIRHQLLPALQKDCRNDVVEQLAALAQNARSFYLNICRSADTVWPDVVTVENQAITLNLNKLSAQSPEVKIEIVRRSLAHLDAGEQDLTENHYQNILSLREDVKLQLPGEVEVHRQGGTVIFNHPQVYECRAGLAPPKKLNIPGKTDFSGVLIETEIFDYDESKFSKFKEEKNNTVEWFDYDKLILPLEIRIRKTGDRFRPLGLKAEKKVGKFLTTAKVSSSLRRKLLIVADSEKIVWLYPVRISEQVKVTSQTKKILQLRISSPSG